MLALEAHTFQGLCGTKAKGRSHTESRAEMVSSATGPRMNPGSLLGETGTLTLKCTVLVLNKADEEPSGDCCAEPIFISEINWCRAVCHSVPPFSATGAFSGLGMQAPVGPWRLLCLQGAHLFLGRPKERKTISAAAESQCLYLNFPRTGKLVVFMA